MYTLSTIIDDGGDRDLDKANIYIGLWPKISRKVNYEWARIDTNKNRF